MKSLFCALVFLCSIQLKADAPFRPWHLMGDDCRDTELTGQYFSFKTVCEFYRLISFKHAPKNIALDDYVDLFDNIHASDYRDFASKGIKLKGKLNPMIPPNHRWFNYYPQLQIGEHLEVLNPSEQGRPKVSIEEFFENVELTGKSFDFPFWKNNIAKVVFENVPDVEAKSLQLLDVKNLGEDRQQVLIRAHIEGTFGLDRPGNFIFKNIDKAGTKVQWDEVHLFEVEKVNGVQKSVLSKHWGVVTWAQVKQQDYAVFNQTISFTVPFAGVELPTAKDLYNFYLDPQNRPLATRAFHQFTWPKHLGPFLIESKSPRATHATKGVVLQNIPGQKLAHTWVGDHYDADEVGLVMLDFVEGNRGGSEIRLRHIVPTRMRYETDFNWYYFHWAFWKRRFGAAVMAPGPEARD